MFFDDFFFDCDIFFFFPHAFDEEELELTSITSETEDSELETSPLAFFLEFYSIMISRKFLPGPPSLGSDFTLYWYDKLPAPLVS